MMTRRLVGKMCGPPKPGQKPCCAACAGGMGGLGAMSLPANILVVGAAIALIAWLAD